MLIAVLCLVAAAGYKGLHHHVLTLLNTVNNIKYCMCEGYMLFSLFWKYISTCTMPQ